MADLTILDPHAVWQHFAELCAVPRGSGKEAQISDLLRDFGRGLGLPTDQDKLGNIVIRKPGTHPGPRIALQAHMDMVWQKSPQSQINFETDPIEPEAKGDWVKASGTTLGADDGIGVAMIMAVLADPQMPHPEIEAIFTVDEEVGMTGAEAIGPDQLTAGYLINLDSEDDASLTIGCAGAVDLVARGTYPTNDTPGGRAFKITLSGGAGGHSGMQIHEGRLNAIKILAQLFERLVAQTDLRLARFDVPGVANVIPGSGSITVMAPADITDQVADIASDLLQPHAQTDSKARITVTLAEQQPTLEADFQTALIEAILACPNGVLKMSDIAEGLVESSSNLALLLCAEGTYEAAALIRSSSNDSRHEIAGEITQIFAKAGVEMDQISDQPAWQPREQSALRDLLEDCYVRTTGHAPKIEAVHAGLECAFFAAKFPDLQMISFGPNITGAHSPTEKVQISSVQKIWNLLGAVLAAELPGG